MLANCRDYLCLFASDEIIVCFLLHHHHQALQHLIQSLLELLTNKAVDESIDRADNKSNNAGLVNVTEPVDDEEEMADADSDGVPGGHGVIIATRIL